MRRILVFVAMALFVSYLGMPQAADAGAKQFRPRVSAGDAHSCLLLSPTNIRCFGDYWFAASDVPLDLPASTSISSGGGHQCAISEQGNLRCWARPSQGYSRGPVPNVPQDIGPVLQVSTGWTHACAVLIANGIRCWGSNKFGESSPPEDLGSVSQVAVSGVEYGHSCALTVDGSVRCWGNNSSGQTNVPAGLGKVRYLSAGWSSTCVIAESDEVRCWGRSAIANVPNDIGPAIQVEVGELLACAIRVDRQVRCWGGNVGSYQMTPPETLGAVQDLSVGWGHAIVLTEDGRAVCWGWIENGRCNIPQDVPLVPFSTRAVKPSPVESVVAVPGDERAHVSWSSPADAPDVSFTVQSNPGGHTCGAIAPATSCTVVGLTNRQSYTFTVTATNAVGTSAASAPSTAVMPLAPGFQVWSDDSVLALGSGTTLRFAQAAAASSIAVTGSAKATVTADSAGFGSTTFTATKAGIQKFTAVYSVKVGRKTTKYTSTTPLYVPSISGPMLKIKQGKTGKFSMQFMPPGAAVSISLTDGRTINLIADSAGKASATQVFNTRGAVNYTVTVSGVQVSTGGLTIS